MFLRQVRKPRGTYLAIVENVYDSRAKKTRQRTVEGIGYLEELKEQYLDPVAYFSKKAAEMTAEKKAGNANIMGIDMNCLMDKETDSIRNVGYGILNQIYRELELDKFWNQETRDLDAPYSVGRIFRLLVFSHLLYSSSPEETYNNKDIYFENIDGFSLDDVYHACDVIFESQKALRTWIFERLSNEGLEDDLESKSVYVRSGEESDAYVAIRFVSSVLIHLLQERLDNRYSVVRILESLRRYSCIKLDVNIYQFAYYDEILEACGIVFGLELDAKYRTQQQIQRLVRY